MTTPDMTSQARQRNPPRAFFKTDLPGPRKLGSDGGRGRPASCGKLVLELFDHPPVRQPHLLKSFALVQVAGSSIKSDCGLASVQ